MPRAIRLLLTLAITLPALAAPASPVAARERERESPPERVSLDLLTSRARAAGAHAPVRPAGPRLASTTLNWVPLGPAPISYDYWSTGSASGRVSAIVVDPRDGDVAYAAAAQGGVWKTLDGGSSWSPLTDGLSSLASGALALHPVNPDIVYYATGEQHFSGDSFYGDGLFVSDDAGATWSQLATRGTVGSYLARILVHARRPDTLYLASDLGFMRSLNGGASWAIGTTPTWCTDVVVDPGRPDTVFAAFYGAGIYRSYDAGATWTPLGGGLPTADLDRINLAIAPSNPQVLYASFATPAGGLLGMYRTADGGDTWTLLPSTPDYLGDQGWYDNCLIVDPSNANVCVAGGLYPYGPGLAGVIRTTNGGSSWSDVTFGVDGFAVHPDQHTLAFGPDGRLWLGNDGGVWRTSDLGDHWTNCNNGLDITQFYAIDVHPADGNRILGGTQDNGTVIYYGSPAWTQVIAGDGGYCLFLWNDPSTYFTTYVYLNPVYEWNAGGFVAEVTGPWGIEADRASFALGPLVQDFVTPNTLLAGTYRAWRSNDRGATWDSLSGDLAAGSVLRALTAGNGAANTIWSGSFEGKVYRTTDASTWNERDAGLPAGAVNDICPDPFDAMAAYLSSDIASGGRVWHTIDGGVSWNDVSGDLPSGVRGLCLAVRWSTAPPTLYLGTDYGVYRSSNGGTNWGKEDAGLPSLAIYDLEFDPAGALVAGTHGRGMWRGTSSITAVTPGDGGGGLALSAPNPMRPPGAVEYRLPEAGEMSLEIYDVLGRRVRLLERGVRQAGVHRATWDGRGDDGSVAGGGIYFYRLRLGDGQRVMKLALLR